ncbi:helix-turn-helix domain-containing protein [Nitrospirillum sp. BR 11828]|uniref:TetR/AcrR family transcriptional regulator n=1 Tax=Nitrospirillum sp. BR 11828 TaxID=3104325 RepID=UPI002ACA076A|nr:helix-turn-helix domain-containing protein [Nitrospirillum sp. BR 11828]MDZ5645824.1 helix-turn-helix domain-containing protein [Nitrospirillum sp. BR 11828]
MSDKTGEIRPENEGKRRVRADAQRNLDALLQAAMAVFATAGVDAPVREIAEKAGVGIGTVYRHFPQRSDLIVAVFRQEVDACADAAPALAAAHDPGEALTRWMRRYVDFIAAKRGLGAALHSGDPAYEALPGYFKDRLVPALQSLLDAAVTAGVVRAGFDPVDLLRAAAVLASPSQDMGPEHGRRMVDLLVDGLRYGARLSPPPPA